MSALKPCPFCGSENVNVEEEEGLYLVMCSGCFTGGPSISIGTGTKEEAAELWNRRPPTEPDQSWLREAVERVLRQVPEAAGSHHKQKIAEQVGLELARAHARARHELRKQVQPRRGS